MISPARGYSPLAPVKIPRVEMPEDGVTRLSSCSRKRRAIFSRDAGLGRLPRRAPLREFGQESREEIAMVMLLVSMRSAMERLRKRPRARRPSARALPIRSNSCLAVRLTDHFFVDVFRSSSEIHPLGVAGLFQQFRQIGPQFPPRLLLLGRQLSERLRVTNTGQDGVALPVLERSPH